MRGPGGNRTPTAPLKRRPCDHRTSPGCGPRSPRRFPRRRAPGPARCWHDAKESNPLDGSFGGSPVTMTYVACRLPRGVVVILYLLDARVNHLVHSIFVSRLFFFGAVGRDSNPRHLSQLTVLLRPGSGKGLKDGVYQVLCLLSYDGMGGAGGSRTRFFPIGSGNLLPSGPRRANIGEGVLLYR